MIIEPWPWLSANPWIEEPLMPTDTSAQDAPVRLRCTRCDTVRDVTTRVETETGDYGSVLATWLAYEVSPPCEGMVDCEGDVSDRHPPRETCSGVEGQAWCPFDGRDDYQSCEEYAVAAVLSDRRRSRE